MHVRKFRTVQKRQFPNGKKCYHSFYIFHIVQKQQGFFLFIGAGCLLVEIQESSNATYRVYDYDRTDKNGHKRELHVDRALQVMDMKARPRYEQRARLVRYYPGCSREILCRCRYFETERLRVSRGAAFTVQHTSFQILLCVNGEGDLAADEYQQTLRFKKGDCVFIPAGLGRCFVTGECELLKVRV